MEQQHILDRCRQLGVNESVRFDADHFKDACPVRGFFLQEPDLREMAARISAQEPSKAFQMHENKVTDEIVIVRKPATDAEWILSGRN